MMLSVINNISFIQRKSYNEINMNRNVCVTIRFSNIALIAVKEEQLTDTGGNNG